MKLLALECATRQCSVALWLDGQTTLRVAAPDARNSDVLLPMARALLAEAGLSLQALDAVAFGAGPGAFTGLRVACGVAQGLAFGADLPVLPVGTLEVLAESLRDLVAVAVGTQREPLRVLAALDARMGECYWSELLEQGEDWHVIRGPLLAAPDRIPLPESAGSLGVGDAFVVHEAALAARLGSSVRLLAGYTQLPDAAALARLASVRWQAGAAIAPDFAQPIYVRDRVALTTAERAAGP
jgi:tRNA threonylcarbamoyladenosine biosynthesis protein TsaB